MRTFISAELPEEVKKNIEKGINELKQAGAAVRWVKTENLHITLKFLGWVEEKNLDKIIELTSKAVSGSGSFKAKFAGMGTFPEGKSPRVIWVGTKEGGGKLCGLAKRIEKTLAKADFKKEKRDFKAHITIGRVKDRKGVDKLKEKIAGLKDLKFGEAVIDHIYIMKSTLTPKGPIYEKNRGVKL